MPFVEFYNAHDRLWKQRWSTIQPLADPGLVRELATKTNFSVASARRGDHLLYVEEWFRKCYGFLPKVTITKTSAEKLHMGADILLDDGNPVADEYRSLNGGATTKLTFIQSPWNRGRGYETIPGIRVVADTNSGIRAILRDAEMKREAPAMEDRTKVLGR
jgi:hypothetical protein